MRSKRFPGRLCLTTLLFSLLWLNGATAQIQKTGTAKLKIFNAVSGLVTDEKGAPLANVNVRPDADPNAQPVKTDANGRFRISIGTATTAKLHFSRSGYADKVAEASTARQSMTVVLKAIAIKREYARVLNDAVKINPSVGAQPPDKGAPKPPETPALTLTCTQQSAPLARFECVGNCQTDAGLIQVLCTDFENDEHFSVSLLYRGNKNMSRQITVSVLDAGQNALAEFAPAVQPMNKAEGIATFQFQFKKSPDTVYPDAFVESSFLKVTVASAGTDTDSGLFYFAYDKQWPLTPRRVLGLTPVGEAAKLKLN